MTTHDGAQSYFSRLNSISEKITFDLNKVKSAHSQDVWLALTLNEQEKILNDHLIDPNIFSKYCHKTEENYAAQDPQVRTELSKNDYRKFCYRDIVYVYNGQDLHTYNYQNVGLKILKDENTGNFRDEHSYPFSFRTKSQINIVLKELKCLVETPIGVKKAINLKVKTTDTKIPILQVNTNDKIDINPTKRKISILEKYPKNEGVYIDEYIESNEKIQLLFKCGSKNSIPNDLSDYENEFKDVRQDENTKLLSPQLKMPKGFDFLSNW
ncbi:uncharacterized protein LOC122622934 [Drosophila teissieri]|uniref:uncharacterized protein LOC122622934 n=1 Tax=Drosophila teissieri TaxID=7243 RepID=UPI001CBA2B67|nr:uncharacterized protein LOC122622934 [Drosophila teissieri]XP_043657670.1 uncharacterized protein LOC122622934 [Drosophila teissieri]XP_043657671.1 uncharacterized protein LOC122622934 [Drosophila teissieri]XP_043657672.1 uncharacterized protein LOC122622934 [Drosophila teissieri]